VGERGIIVYTRGARGDFLQLFRPDNTLVGNNGKYLRAIVCSPMSRVDRSEAAQALSQRKVGARAWRLLESKKWLGNKRDKDTVII
jgi:hypothetical protein